MSPSRALLAFVSLSLLGVLAATAEPQKPAPPATEISFFAVVEKIEATYTYGDDYFPAQVDPKYVVVLKIVSCNPAAAELQPDHKVALGIHSPRQLFAGASDDAAGHGFKFFVIRKVIDGEIHFTGLRLNTGP